MKRFFSLLLIAMLLLCPVLSVRAEGEAKHIYAIDGLFTEEELDALETRANEIFGTYGVAVYFFYDTGIEDLVAYAQTFLSEHVSEANALILGVNADYYHFLRIGAAIDAFPMDVCDGTLWEAFRSVKNDPAGKVGAYLNAVDSVLKTYAAEHGSLNTLGYASSNDEPRYIARTAGGKPTLVEHANLLTPQQAADLSKRLKEIGDAYQCDVVVVTVQDMGYKTAEQYADDYFDYNGYGYGAVPDETGKTVDGDGILLFLSMKERDFAISTSGYGITAFTDYGIQKYLEPLFLPDFGIDDFYSGFNAFADGCEALLKQARAGEPFDVGTVSEKTANGKPVLMDMAGILEPEQVETLSKRLKSVGDKYQCDVIFITDTVSYPDGETYAKNYYQSNGYGYHADGQDRGGILAYYSDASGELAFYTEGVASKAFVGRGLYKFRQEILRAVNRGDFSDVVKTYGDQTETYLNSAQNGRVINPINWFPILLAVLAGVLIAFIPVNAMKRQLTDVGKQTQANSYMEPDSFAMTQNSDVLLGTNIARTVHIVQSSSGGGGSGGGRGGGGGFHGGSSTHTSSSGGTHGGHSGKF